MSNKKEIDFNNNLEIELLDPEKLIKMNMLKPITNPVYFARPNVPNDDGLLSNEIFGITQYERGSIFAYIDLNRYFINPLIYKKWLAMDKRINDIIYESKTFIVNSKGEFEEDENGETGIEFLRKNIDKIKIRQTSSAKRDTNIDFIMNNKDKIFMKHLIVIPAYYRDVNSTDKGTGVGEINKLYNNIILAVRSLKETQDYGLSMSAAVTGRIQQLITAIYDWFTAGKGLDGIKKESVGLSKKGGLVRRAVMSKTSDYASRLVISAPTVKAERVEDLQTNIDYCSLPLASAAVNLFPFVLFNIRRFFDNEFASGKYPVRNKKTGEVEFLTIKEPAIQFSDDNIKKNIDRFIKGFANRFIPITIETVEGRTVYMKFKGRNIHIDNVTDEGNVPILDRKLTWCDIIYRACVEAAKGKHVLITRYPLEDYFGQFPNKINIASTVETEPMVLGNDFYPYYPKIREEDIGTNTSNKFIDTLNISNLFLPAIGGKAI